MQSQGVTSNIDQYDKAISSIKGTTAAAAASLVTSVLQSQSAD